MLLVHTLPKMQISQNHTTYMTEKNVEDWRTLWKPFTLFKDRTSKLSHGHNQNVRLLDSLSWQHPIFCFYHASHRSNLGMGFPECSELGGLSKNDTSTSLCSVQHVCSNTNFGAVHAVRGLLHCLQLFLGHFCKVLLANPFEEVSIANLRAWEGQRRWEDYFVVLWKWKHKV